MRALTCLPLLLLALTGMAGCGGGTRPLPPPDRPEPPPAEPQALEVEAEPLAETTPVPLRCDEQASERCNGLDDDCNGRIDDGCDYGGGALQVAVAWNTNADIELSLTDPDGNTIEPEQPEAPSGGRMVRRRDCDAGAEEPRVASIAWPRGATPPPGRYQVTLRRRGCGSEPAPTTTTTTSVAVDGQVLGPFNRTLSTDEPTPVLRIRLTGGPAHGSGANRHEINPRI